MPRLAFLSVLGLLLVGPAFARGQDIARRQYLDNLDRILPPVPQSPAAPAFSDWEKSSGELPPDFDALPKSNTLPDPFKFLDGSPVQFPADWPRRRAEILSLFEHYEFGKIPPKPKLDNVVIESETHDNGVTARTVRLEFGPQDKGIMHVSLLIPDGDKPMPVFFGPGLIGGFFGNGQANTVLRRGYIAASYRANDGADDALSLVRLYPDYDFSTLTRRAWSAQMVVDYLLTLRQVDPAHIAIFGYSRDGKMATIAAALDDRIRALVAGSTGVGGVLPWRYAGEANQAESIESTTRMFPDWFIRSLRYFSGREDRLPVDANLLVALIAPRPVLMVYGLNDEVSNSWGNEAAYRAMLPIYDHFNDPGRLGILRVPGVHGDNDMEQDLDFLDMQFGRQQRTWVNNFLFPWDWAIWQKRSGETVDLTQFPQHAAGELSADSTTAWQTQADQIRKSASWMLGPEPYLPVSAAGGGRGGRGGFGGPRPGQLNTDVVSWIIGRTTIREFGWLAPERDQVNSRKVSFGYGVTGDLYTPKDAPAGKKLPTVIWLHGYSYPLGYMWVYRVDLHPILALTKAGYAVLAFDQCGFGSRMAEAGPFYDRFPHWSQLGRMVEDTRAAVTALQKDAQVDPGKVYLFGYSMGGMVALHTAALDPRVAGVVSISGFTPMRTDSADKGPGELGEISQLRGISPRLAFFIGHESQIPYDYDGLIACIAPRPVYVLQPQLDRRANVADVRAAVGSARKIYTAYNAADHLVLDDPWDYARFSGDEQSRVIDWMTTNMR